MSFAFNILLLILIVFKCLHFFLQKSLLKYAFKKIIYKIFVIMFWKLLSRKKIGRKCLKRIWKSFDGWRNKEMMRTNKINWNLASKISSVDSLHRYFKLHQSNYLIISKIITNYGFLLFPFRQCHHNRS